MERLSASPGSAEAACLGVLRSDISDVLEAIGTPTLLISGSRRSPRPTRTRSIHCQSHSGGETARTRR